jgi:hypothetical protein
LATADGVKVVIDLDRAAGLRLSVALACHFDAHPDLWMPDAPRTLKQSADIAKAGGQNRTPDGTTATMRGMSRRGSSPAQPPLQRSGAMSRRSDGGSRRGR